MSHSLGLPTEIAWLGDVPADWPAMRLKYLVNFCGGGTPAKGEHRYWGGEIPWVSPKDMRAGVIRDTEDHITQDAVDESATRMVPAGAVLIVVRSGILRHTIPVAITARPVALNQDMKALIPRSGIDARYLKYVIRGRQHALLLAWTKTGATVQSIEHDLLANTSFPVPPPQLQRAIADFLDAKTAAIDMLIAKKERLIERIEERQQATINRATTKGLNCHAPMKESRVEWLGQVPVHWEVAPVFARYSVQLGKMLNPHAASGEHSAPYLRNANVQWGKVMLDDLREMSFSPSERQKFALRPGDLLVCEGGDIGRTAIWGGELAECFYQKAIHRLRPLHDDQNTRYFYYIMRTAAHRGAFLAEGNQSTIVHLTAEKLRRHRFPFPPRHEQASIVEYLDRQGEKTDALIRREVTVMVKLREYCQTLISAAVTGQMDESDFSRGAEELAKETYA